MATGNDDRVIAATVDIGEHRWAVRDGNLLTGQKPASSAPLADSVLAALR